ncbi:hypothetical protein [Longispora albida]|uniref:hypothetical protein n=1 Tax=Longispora albida TaxID=203523 RepID=UPI000369B03D|nr:hypothetical protein [Longispora albida]
MLSLTAAQHRELGEKVRELLLQPWGTATGPVLFADGHGGFGCARQLPAGCQLIATRAEVDLLLAGYGFHVTDLDDEGRRSAFVALMCAPVFP